MQEWDLSPSKPMDRRGRTEALELLFQEGRPTAVRNLAQKREATVAGAPLQPEEVRGLSGPTQMAEGGGAQERTCPE